MSRNILVLWVLALLALAGCTKQDAEFTANDQVPAEQRTVAEGTEGGGEPAAEVDGVFVAAGTDLTFDEAPSTLPAGDVTITLNNESGLPHDVTFEGVNGDAPVVVTNGQDTDTGSVTLQPGTFTFYCSVPGHRQAGMEGTVTVS